jgi:hypothetical protein
MSSIAEQSDAKLKTMEARAASSLEQLVRDAINLVDSHDGNAGPNRLPTDFFTRISREFGSEPLERPPQGESEKREVTGLCR